MRISLAITHQIRREQNVRSEMKWAYYCVLFPLNGDENVTAICTLMHGDVAAVSVAVNQRVLGPASLIWANAATSNHLLHISGHAVAKYHLQTAIKSSNVYIESSLRISNIHVDEKSIFDVVSFTLASDGSQEPVKKKVQKTSKTTVSRLRPHI